MLLTKSFTADEFERALESWRWLGVEGKTPVLASLFGDVSCRTPPAWRSHRPRRRQVMPFVVIMHILGQVHEQLDDLPEDEPVYGLDVDDAGDVSLRRTP